MAVAIDGAGGSSAPAGASSATFSVAVGNGANRFLIAAPAWYTVGGTGTVSSVVFNTSESLTVISGSLINDSSAVAGADKQGTALYQLVAPSNATANVVMTGGATYYSWGGGAVPWTGVDQSTPVGTPVTNSSQNSTTPTVTLTGAAGEIMLASLNGVNGSAFNTADTDVWVRSNGALGISYTGAYQAATGGADTIASSGGVPGFGFVASAVAIKPVSAGGGITGPLVRSGRLVGRGPLVGGRLVH